jgi:quercetin dioxygenase-like cupin family protein
MTATYQASPRPTFDAPAAIPYATVTRHLWGDEAAGLVADWIYVSSMEIHQLVFGLGPGGRFTHSPAFRTVFAADEVLYVLSGTMAIANPETGEVHLVEPGEAAFFRRDTWHHAWNRGTDELRVLELFSPPPAQGTSGSYARTRPYLDTPRYTRDDLLGDLPAGADQASRNETIRVIRPADIHWRLEGDTHPVPVGLLASTEHLTVGTLTLLPGEMTDTETHGGAESLYVVAGTLHVQTPGSAAPSFFELAARDGFYLPTGTPHRYANYGSEPATVVFGVAPRYRPDAPA